MLYYGPEVILITDEVLFQAKKVYQVLESIPVSKKDTFFSQYTNDYSRLKTYVETITGETITDS